MHVYFSHSYRDVAINSYFLQHFVDEDIPLRADQKTDVWCVAKLERYLSETTGFVSIVSCRPTDADVGGFSSYIGHELNLARRARVPRLLFVDQQVLSRHPLDFPEDAVPFHPGALDDERERHGDAIRSFTKALETAHRASPVWSSNEATLVVAEGATLRDAGLDVAEVLKRAGYGVTLLFGNRPGRGLEDIRLLETLWRAQLCVFIMGQRLSDAHIALAMAHAHCIPSIRMEYDGRSADTSPSLAGVIRWANPDDMLLEFSRQLTSYQKGLVEPVEIANSSTPTDAARSIGTMNWAHRPENVWDVDDGAALARHVHPDHMFVRDEVDRVRAQVGSALGRVASREGAMEVCALLYEGMLRHRFGYELEQPGGAPGTQLIRTPRHIVAHRTATCIDVACLFASMLEAAGQNPLLVVLEGPEFAHALAGYRVPGEPSWEHRGVSDLRGAVARRDAVLFEATGAVEADEPVGDEAPAERRGKLIASFEDAKRAAERMLMRGDVHLRHFVDIRQQREGDQQGDR
jgi:hypothetical protein